MKKGAASSTDAAAAEAAEEMLAAHGSAADAVLAGWLAASGERPTVLLAPAVALVAGAGAGARAFDGRALQPGAGVARPRGAASASAVVDQARAAVPRAPAMAALLHATRGRRPLREVAKRGIERAKAQRAVRRATTIERLAASGASAVRREDFVAALLRVAGVNAGGLLTEEDLALAVPTDEPARVYPTRGDTGEEMRLVFCPWPSTGEPPGRVARTLSIVAADAWGLVAAIVAVETSDLDALHASDLEVHLPAFAVPVMRGQTRVAPRTALPIPQPVVLVDCGADLRAAVAGGALAGALGIDQIAIALAKRPIESGLGETAAVAAIADPTSARAWRAA